MKTREEVEKLKQDWKHDAVWDIETTEGFEEYKDELKQYRLDVEKEIELKRQKRHEYLESLLCPIMCAGALADSEVSKPTITCKVEKCAWWDRGNEQCAMMGISRIDDIAEASRVFTQIHQ